MTVSQVVTLPCCGCDAGDKLHPLASIDEALKLIAAHAAPATRTEVVALDSAFDRVLAQLVSARSMAPAFDNAAMDGYALVTSALTGTGPWVLRVVARVPAGQGTKVSITGAVAARIFTGAPIPDGADAVVMQEDVRRDGDVIHLSRRPEAGLNIRQAGSDMAAGTVVLEKGRKLGPREIAACAAAGAGFVRVQRKLRVALLVTGDEVRCAGGEREAAQIWDVNTPMLTASLAAAGVEIVSCAHGADTMADLVRQLGDMTERADLVVTSGGISVGEEDHMKPAFKALGGDILFSGVAIKPGKPVSCGRIGKAYWLGLPGNPVSAYVTWQVFGTALVRALTGDVASTSIRRHVVTDIVIRRKPGRCELRPAMLAGFDAHGREIIQFENATNSARVGCLPVADGLMFLPAHVESLPAGALVEFQPFCRS